MAGDPAGGGVPVGSKGSRTEPHCGSTVVVVAPEWVSPDELCGVADAPPIPTPRARTPTQPADPMAILSRLFRTGMRRSGSIGPGLMPPTPGGW